MATDSSGEESAFADCASSGVDRGGKGGRRRQCSVPEMLQRAGSRKSKRQAPGRGSRSPPDAVPPAAKRVAAPSVAEPPPAAAAAPAPAAVELSPGALASIQLLIDAGNARIISAIDAKIDILERRVSILEGESMDKGEEIRRLHYQLEQQGRALEELQLRVEGIDSNRRLSSLILTCEDFAVCPDEDIEEKVTQTVNKRLQKIKMTVADIQVAHRLQGKNKVIVRFVKRKLRDAIYDSRFELFTGAAGRGQRSMAPLYLSESLTPGNRLLYTALLDARKPENGGRIASVFTRRGQVFCRTEKGGSNIRVPDWERLQQILERAARGSPSSGRSAAVRGRGGGPPPSRLAGRTPSPAVGESSYGEPASRQPPPEVTPASPGVNPAAVPAAVPAGGPAGGLAVSAGVSPAAGPPVTSAAAPAAAPTAASAAGPTPGQPMDVGRHGPELSAPDHPAAPGPGLHPNGVTASRGEGGSAPDPVGGDGGHPGQIGGGGGSMS